MRLFMNVFVLAAVLAVPVQAVDEGADAPMTIGVYMRDYSASAITWRACSM